VGDGLIGRAVGSSATDRRQRDRGTQVRRLEVQHPIVARAVHEPLQTGIKAIDSRRRSVGASELIIGDRKTGRPPSGSTRS
jgi:F0F1-type ATP synthase alpha subunit